MPAVTSADLRRYDPKTDTLAGRVILVTGAGGTSAAL